MEGEIINRIALSPLITFDLADYHDQRERIALDIAPQLFRGMILREKDFREWIAATDWSVYQDQHIRIFCSVEAIIPGWAWMLLTIQLEPFASTVVFGEEEAQEIYLWRQVLDTLDYTQFQDKKIVVKGCGDIEIPQTIYVELIRRLRPLASKLMYGEPCSTVPLYKKPKQRK